MGIHRLVSPHSVLCRAPPASPAPQPHTVAMFSLVVLLAAACASAPHEVYGDMRFLDRNDRSIRAIGPPELPHGCMYEGRWFTEGAVVTTHEACLRCVCVHGALACRRRACASLPDPPPHRCHVLHRRGSCCPELHCPDGVTVMEHGASARFENDDFSDVATPASIVHACVEGGTVYSAGSAMESTTACEQCFCLGGARRCVRPRCLPPPAGCHARPSSGACCPQRYYCEHVSTRPPDQKHMHDCEVEGRLIPEGERVLSAEASRNCTRCFCLRGLVRCQPLACAPPLLGCKPLLRPGQCCPHQYHCEHKQQGLVTPHLSLISDNALVSTRSNDRSFHPSKSNEISSTTKTVTTSLNTTKKAPSTLTTKTSPVPTTKVKRKTNDPPPASKLKLLNTTTISTTQKSVSTTAIVSETEKTTTEQSTEKISTEQPEGTVKITVNGTINCTAELSSTSLPLNITVNDTEKINMESLPRVPDSNKLEIEAHTSSYPNDIITDRNVDGGFDENESFVINVTSSLTTNTSYSSPKPISSTFSKVTVPVDLVDAMNNSKKTKGEYDYDYTEPTLPPSLPNLKIIPFVAADAVVDEDVSSKDTMSYPILEREDKFPVYYPTVEAKETPFARREDKFPPTQYPVFVSEKVESYPPSSEDLNLSSASYPNAHNDLTREYTVSSLIGNHNMEMNNAKKITTKPASSTFAIKTPAVNLFSPPVETEGGFIPKGPGIIDEYYAVYPSTPPGPPVPHLTTSMQLDIIKGECVTGDGRHIPEGDSIPLACSICTCAWGELHCSPRPCHTPSGCRRRPASNNAGDLCCGELVCEKVIKKTTPQAESTTEKIKIDTSSPSIENKTEPINDTLQDKMVEIPNNNTAEHNADIFDNNTAVKVPNNNKTKLEETTSNPISLEKLTSIPSTTTSTTAITTITTPTYKESNETINNSQEYDEEDDDDEGFFGNVLKLILSDNYETTIAPYKKKSTTPVTVSEAPKITTPLTTTTRRPSPKPSIAQFIPMPHHHMNYVPPKTSFQQNTVNRIDHLVLGEATAIKKTTPRPLTTAFKTKIVKPYPTNRPSTPRPNTQRPFMTTRLTEATKVEPSVQYTPRPYEGSRPPSPSFLPGMGPGLLKLAGCNIYGRMYRVGRIIAELSTPCQECWCTELGVQCKQLNC